MAEEELSEAPSGETGANGGGDPAAIALALAGASRAKADAFLDDQRTLIADQRELVQLQAKELAHELRLRHWSLQLRHASAILKFALEVSAALIGLALACFIGAAVWNAAHADGLVIESFSVPPDLAQRGLTGDVVAGELLDRLSELNQETISSRSSKSYAASWGDDIKVEIPDTGISVAQAYRFLRRWLGHESHLSGAVWHGRGGIVITARSDGKSVTVAGPGADIDGQIQKVAEAVFGLAEPYRYGIYLSLQGRYAEANTVFRQQVENGSAVDRAWGLIGLARSANGDVGPRERARLYRQAAQLDPNNVTALNNLVNAELLSSRLEDAVATSRKQIALLGRGGDTREGTGGGLSLPVMREGAEDGLRDLTGAYREEASSIANIIARGEGVAIGGLATTLIVMDIQAHDLKAARAIPRDRDRRARGADLFAFDGARADMDLADAEENWPAVIAAASSANAIQKGRAGLHDLYLLRVVPVFATAQARLGHFRDAEALIAATPGDCDECMVRRAQIAELEGQHARADWWFARAVHDAPSIPMMTAAWGQALLERGKPDAAIAQFTLANQKGPHFADPLEGWGEALMAKNRSDLALAKFEEANKYAPDWGRLHLKWGEALIYAGKRDDAKAQLARASQLDLTPSEKAELAGMARS